MDLYQEPFPKPSRMSRARDEPLPISQLPVDLRIGTSTASFVKSPPSIEADRLSAIFFHGVFAQMEIEADLARKRAEALKYERDKQNDAPTLHLIETGIFLEVSKHGSEKRFIYSVDYPPVADFLKGLEVDPSQLLMETKGKVKEWSAVNLPAWYTRILANWQDGAKTDAMDEICFVLAALQVYNMHEHPANTLFWNSLTCRAQSDTADKQAVWERTAAMVEELLGEFGRTFESCDYTYTTVLRSNSIRETLPYGSSPKCRQVQG
jgi:hypothetical protein